MNGVADHGQTGKPYGLVGLCLSLIGIGISAFLVVGVIGYCAMLIIASILGLPLTHEVLRDPIGALQQSDATAALRTIIGIALLVYLAVASAILLFARRRGGKAWCDLVAWRPMAFRLNDKVLWSICAGALIYDVAAGLTLSYFAPKSMSSFTIPSDRVAVAILFITAVLFAPVTEELLFRGWIYTSLRFRFGLWTALLVSSALFAVAHYESTHLYALAVFPIGLALGAIRARTGSVKAGILFHACNNLIAFCAAALNIG